MWNFISLSFPVCKLVQIIVEASCDHQRIKEINSFERPSIWNKPTQLLIVLKEESPGKDLCQAAFPQ